MNKNGEEICRQAASAFQAKSNLNIFWQESAEHFYPERATFTVEKLPGEDFASKLYKSDPILFRRDFAGWLGAVLRPKGRDWFMPRARQAQVNERTSVRSYFESRAATTRNLIYDIRSQFIAQMVIADHDYATFGNSVMTVEERQDKSGFRYRSWHLRDCAWRENYDGEIDWVARKFRQSIRNLCSRERTHGWNIDPKLKEKLQNSGETLVNCLHVLMSIYDYDYDSKLRRKAKGRKWISLYIDQDNNHIMSEKPVFEFNYAISRWHRIPESPYAFSPSVIACLPDARTIQTMTWSILEAGEKAVEPPIIAVNEAIIGGVNTYAGGVTWVDTQYDERTGEAMRALDLGKNPQLGEAILQGIKGTMMDAWYLNKLFLPPVEGGEKMTAAEVSRRDAEYLRNSQPIIDPAETERNGWVLDLTMTMAMRLGYWGSFEDMPRELRGQDIDLTYDNPIEDARRRAKANAYRESAEIIAMQMQIKPEVVAQFDSEKAFREAITGVAPPDWLLDEEDAKAATEEAAADQQANQALGEIATVADAAGKVMGKGAPPQQQMAA